MTDVVKHPLRLVAAGLCLSALAAGCGQKGPLFLPGDRGEVQTEIPLPDRVEEELGEDDDLPEQDNG